jgi:CDP-diglyceride synthetase
MVNDIFGSIYGESGSMNMNATDSENAKALMTLIGGALGFAAVALSIINAYLQKAKTEQDRIKVIMTILNISGMVLAVAGAIVVMVFGVVKAPIFLFSASCLLSIIVYMASPDKPSRADTITIILLICNVISYINAYMIGRILGLIEGNTSLIGKLTDILNKR